MPDDMEPTSQKQVTLIPTDRIRILGTLGSRSSALVDLEDNRNDQAVGIEIQQRLPVSGTRLACSGYYGISHGYRQTRLPRIACIGRRCPDSLPCNALMLLTTEIVSSRRQAFAARQVNPANLAPNHVFGAGGRICLNGVTALRAISDQHVGGDKDSDQKQELGQDPHHLPVDC